MLLRRCDRSMSGAGCRLVFVPSFAGLIAGWGLAICLLGLATPAAADEPQRPNIVLFLADDLGIYDLSCDGRGEHSTPRIDTLARQGMRLTEAYTSQPICSPSRAALLTGLTPARLHLTNYLPGRPDAPSQKLLQPVIEGQLPLEERTLAELLREAGYATGLFGKWHLGGGAFGPLSQGFELAVSPPETSTPTADEGGKSEFAVADAAIEFIRAHRDQPFFCYVPHSNPHIPLVAQAERIKKYRDAYHPTYAAMLETLDESVGRVLDVLEELDLSQRTIVIFTSDNGGLHVLEFPGTPPTHCGPYRAGKGYVYEGGLRVPLIVRWPGVVPAASVSTTPCQLADLMPTLLEAAGIDVAGTVGPLDGVSLSGVWRGEALGDRDLFWHFPNYTNQGGRPASVIRAGRWKLIEHLEDGRLELFDLETDRSEQHDLVAEQADKVAELRERLQTWRVRVGAAMPAVNPEFDAAAHRALYLDQDSSQLRALATAEQTAEAWKAWREAMNQAVAGRRPRVTPSSGDLRLQARDAMVHGELLRYEPEPHKNVLGYWTRVDDWAEWKFQVPVSGEYEVEIQQGCGDGSGGAEVDVLIGEAKLSFVVQETGHFQKMILRNLGTVKLEAGTQTLELRPRSKPGVAVMDVRRIVLRPVMRIAP